MFFLLFTLKSYTSPTPHSDLSVSFHSKLLFAGIQEARHAYSSLQRRKLRTNNSGLQSFPAFSLLHSSFSSVSELPIHTGSLPTPFLLRNMSNTQQNSAVLQTASASTKAQHTSLEHFELCLQVAWTESICICCPKSNIPALLLTLG